MTVKLAQAPANVIEGTLRVKDGCMVAPIFYDVVFLFDSCEAGIAACAALREVRGALDGDGIF
jgi:hypothetical protein